MADPVTHEDVVAARDLVGQHLPPTPLYEWPGLSQRLGCQYYLKHENHLPTGAFKVRGGVNLVGTLSDDERQRGLIAVSTGNHGQSLAFACRRFGVRRVVADPYPHPDHRLGFAAFEIPRSVGRLPLGDAPTSRAVRRVRQGKLESSSVLCGEASGSRDAEYLPPDSSSRTSAGGSPPSSTTTSRYLVMICCSNRRRVSLFNGCAMSRNVPFFRFLLGIDTNSPLLP